MQPTSFRDLIELWPQTNRYAEFASAMGVPYYTAYRWHERDSIPPQYWPRLIAELRAIDHEVSADHLIALSVARKVQATA